MSEQQQDDIERLESTIATLRSRIAALELENTQAWTEVEKWKVIAIDSQADLEASNADLRSKLTASESEVAGLREALVKVREDINWMLNNRQFLDWSVFDYLDK